MLNHDYWKELELELCNVCRTIINKVSQSDYNKNIYMFALDVNQNYGSILIAVNTEELIFNRIKNYYPDASCYSINGVRGIKYNPGECEEFYFYAGELSKTMENLIRQYDSTIENLDFERYEQEINMLKFKFIDSMVVVLNTIKPYFTEFNTTEDFIVFTTIAEAEQDEKIELIKRTVDSRLFNKVFPEVQAYKAYLDYIQRSMTTSEQAKHWISCYIDFSLDNKSLAVAKLKEMMVWMHDIDEQIVSLNQDGINELIKVSDKFARMRYFENGITVYGNIATHFLMLIERIDVLSENQVESLLDLLKDVFYMNENIEINDSVIPWLAKVIHSAKPDEYPNPVIGNEDNKLKNFEEFGL